MEKLLKTIALPPNSAVVVSMKQYAWISNVGSIAEKFPQKTELSVVSKLNKKPIALVDIISIKNLTNEDKTFVRDVIKPKVDKIAVSIMEMSFKLILKHRMLQENNITESELFERFPSLPQWVVLFNNTQEEVEVELPEQFVLPKIFSASFV